MRSAREPVGQTAVRGTVRAILTKIIEGKPSGKGLRFGVVVGRFNSFVTDKLLDGALDALKGAA